MDINRFLDIEKKHALYTMQINGINYWNYSRVQIWNFEICAQQLGLNERHQMKKLSPVEKVKTALILVKNSILRGRIPYGTDILFSAHERRTKINGVYQCIYTEPLAKLFPGSAILDVPYEYKHLQPASDIKRYYTDYIIVSGNLHYQIHKSLRTAHYRKTLALVESQMLQPLKEIISAYNLQIPVKRLIGILHKKFLVVEQERKLYRCLLEKVKPKAIVEVVYYSMHNMMLNELAKQHGIPTIELQHGVMHKNHAAYQFNWDSVIPQFPDRMFLFSDFWKEMIHVPIADGCLITTGFPYFEKNRQKYMADNTAKDGKTILFISQGTIGDKLSRLAAEAADSLLTEGYHIIYKLHPAEAGVWEENYPWLKKMGIEVEGIGGRDIYECFSVSSVQVGVYSTAIYEGLGFGLRTFLYDVGHAESMYCLVEKGFAQMISNSSELIGLLTSEAAPLQEIPFWADDALHKMEDALQALL